jgi:subtilisin family serine protease
MEKEYVVTLKKKDDLDVFYDDMETSGGSEYIPDRVVDVYKRRANSRNTHYILTEEEAEALKKDPRILSVSLTPEELGVIVRPFWSQQSDNFQRSITQASSHVNWGLLRSSIKSNIPNWGESNPNQSATVYCSDEGRNVDVVISDGMVDPSHPEFAINVDGTGGSRVIQYNWLQHRSVVEGLPNSNYIYAPYADLTNADRRNDNAHGIHVAGTVAGNRQGFARQANIYNINPYGSDINNINTIYHIDYIREFHRTKPINPLTGRKNPTIVNMSWGYRIFGPTPSSLTRVFYNGVMYEGPFTSYTYFQLWQQFNLTSPSGSVGPIYLMYRYAAVDADIQDAINDGIIMVGAAGNNCSRMDTLNGSYYNSYAEWSGSSFGSYFYQRGSTPSSASNVICVGSLDSYVYDAIESKSSFSNFGRRVDIFAPGHDIQSSMILTNPSSPPPTDPRSSSHYLQKYNGTSMASPQVCGVLACLMERYPNIKQEDAVNFLTENFNSLNNIANPLNDLYYSIEDTPNRLLYNFQERKYGNAIGRPDDGNAYPSLSRGLRKNKNAKYPRVKVNR